MLKDTDVLQFDKFYTIGQLKNMQRDGEFIGHPEEFYDFDLVAIDELEWYFYNWLYDSYVEAVEDGTVSDYVILDIVAL